MAAQCVEEKCNQKPSCEDACAAKAKAGAMENCKKDDKECLAKFKQMAAKCVQEKCKAVFEGGDCEARRCKPDDQEFINKFKKMAAKCVEKKMQRNGHF